MNLLEQVKTELLHYGNIIYDYKSVSINYRYLIIEYEDKNYFVTLHNGVTMSISEVR